MNKQLLKKAILEKPYIYYFFLTIILYLAINVILSEFYITIQYIPKYLQTIKWSELIFSALLALIISFLVALNLNLIIIRYKESKKLNIKLTPIGFLLGLSAGICPACITGLFPALFSIFGFSLSILPFGGIEFQILSILILLLSIFLLSKDSKRCSVQ